MFSRLSGYFKQFVAEVIGSPELQRQGLQEVKQDALAAQPFSPSDDGAQAAGEDAKFVDPRESDPHRTDRAGPLG